MDQPSTLWVICTQVISPLKFILCSGSIIWFLRTCLSLFDYYWWTPRRLKLIMMKQGITGPPPQLLFGNAIAQKRLLRSVPDDLGGFRHDCIVDRVAPDYVLWSRLYGKQYLLFIGVEPRIVLSDMDVVKEIFSTKNTLSSGKTYMIQKMLEPVIGMGMVLANGNAWAHQKRVIGPAFHMNKLKGLAETMMRSVDQMLEVWDQLVRDGGGKTEVEMGEQIAGLTADIIARTQFGSSYKKGKQIFANLDCLRALAFEFSHYNAIPWSRFLPASSFRKMRKLRSEVDISIIEIIEERMGAVKSGRRASYGTDLLGLMLAESQGRFEDQDRGGEGQLSMRQLVDECKTFLLVGHEATAQMLTWCMLLLAHNPSWQDRARAAVIDVFKERPLDIDLLNDLKILDWIFYETMRLYSPVVLIARVALADMKLGHLFIPKGMTFAVPIPAIHLNPQLWGDDVFEFRPDRFEKGIAKASKHPMAFMPFIYGPRHCIGQGFAMMEAKLIVAKILKHFVLQPSHSYRHAPMASVTLRPQHGAQLIIQQY